MQVQNVKPITKGSGIASFDLMIETTEKVKFLIKEMKWMKSEQGGEFIIGPSRSYEDSHGNKKYFNIVQIDKEDKDQFSRKCIDLVKPIFERMQHQPPCYPGVGSIEECPF